MHAIEYVTVQDSLVGEGKIHDSFVIYYGAPVIRCDECRALAGVGCLQRVISFGFQFSHLSRIVAGKSQIDLIAFRKCILFGPPVTRTISDYFCVASEMATLA